MTNHLHCFVCCSTFWLIAKFSTKLHSAWNITCTSTLSSSPHHHKSTVWIYITFCFACCQHPLSSPASVHILTNRRASKQVVVFYLHFHLPHFIIDCSNFSAVFPSLRHWSNTDNRLCLYIVFRLYLLTYCLPIFFPTLHYHMWKSTFSAWATSYYLTPTANTSKLTASSSTAVFNLKAFISWQI